MLPLVAQALRRDRRLGPPLPSLLVRLSPIRVSPSLCRLATPPTASTVEGGHQGLPRGRSGPHRYEDRRSGQRAKALDKIKSAINYVSDVRGTLGATQNRLDHTINNLSVMQENIQDAESTIRDTDVADEMMAYTKNNILIQSAQAMLAQANQVPQGVLQLLQ